MLEEHRHVDLIHHRAVAVQRFGTGLEPAAGRRHVKVFYVSEVAVFELDAAHVKGRGGALENEEAFGREGPGHFRADRVVGRCGEISVAAFEILRVREWEKIAVEIGVTLAVMAQPCRMLHPGLGNPRDTAANQASDGKARSTPKRPRPGTFRVCSDTV